MSSKIQHLLNPVLAAIDNLKNGQYLDTSNLELSVVNDLLSTHQNCGFTITNPLRARQAELINSTLVENNIPDHDDCILEKICPSEIYSGMLIAQHGYVGKVETVERYESTDRGVINELEPFVYQVLMTYVSGDLGMHKYFTSSINNGCDRGYLSVNQGNRRATFQRVIENN
jgi:hypothetical protein